MARPKKPVELKSVPKDSEPQKQDSKPAPRSVDQIQAEYINVCTSIGDKEYRVKMIQNDLVQAYNSLYELNQENARAQAETAHKAAQTKKDPTNV